MPYSIEVVRKVYNDEEGVCIHVGSDEDGLGLVELRTADPASKQFYGDFRITLSKDMALLVAKAIIDTANEVE